MHRVHGSRTKGIDLKVIKYPAKMVALGMSLAVLALGSLVPKTADAASWVTNSPLSVGRYGHSATLLTNGQVLVVGGATSTEYTASAELFDPTTSRWTNTGAMRAARLGPTLTPLTNGLVLVTGGQGPTGGLSSTELYNPGTRLWETNGALNRGRHGHTATLLSDGRVLAAGGYAGLNTSDLELDSAEIYDPVTRAWTATGSLTSSRQQHTATLLLTGQVLVAGGIGSNNVLATAELYDPNPGTWTPTEAMGGARRIHTATRLPDGQVLIAGGAASTNDIPVAELYHPSTRSWTTTGVLHLPRNAHTATLLPNGNVLVAGGWSLMGVMVALAETYDATTGEWTVTKALNTARAYHSATRLPSGQVMLAGGYRSGGYLSSTEVFVQAAPINLINPASLPTGAFQFGFTNLPGLGFSVLAAGNPSLASSNWAAFGGVTEISPGHFQFTDPQATNSAQRFYRVQAD